jgi:hypothetical protein
MKTRTSAPSTRSKPNTPSTPPPAAQPDYPHYSVQSNIYSFLQTALNLAVLNERLPRAGERQRLISFAIDAYETTCDHLVSRPTKRSSRDDPVPARPSSALSAHYSAQTPIYALLLAALHVAVSYEKFPGFDDRQKLIESAVTAYQNVCDPLPIGTDQH